MNKPDYIGQAEWDILQKKYANNFSYVEEKIKNNYPIQYLIGNVDFMGNIINVNESVLIPRYETELLVEKTISMIKDLNNNPNILDIGTGSGCIAITIAKELNATVDAIDISEDALNVAKMNASINNVKVNFYKKDILSENLDKKYDVIISNPPYVDYSEVVDPQTKYEPQNAIFAQDNGLLFYKEILKKAVNSINKPGLISFEIGCTQARSIADIAKNLFKNSEFIIEKDFNNKDRYLFIKINE